MRDANVYNSGALGSRYCEPAFALRQEILFPDAVVGGTQKILSILEVSAPGGFHTFAVRADNQSRKKLENNNRVDFPDSLVDNIALWTPDFSFAYLKEVFVSSLLIMASNENDDDAESFEAIIKRQIETLKKEMGDGSEMIQSMSGLEI